MNASSRYLGLFVLSLFAVATVAPAYASPHLTCNVVPLSVVRGIIGGSPIYKPGSIKHQGDSTISDCGYTSGVRGGFGVLIMLMTAPSSSLVKYASGLRSVPRHGGGATEQKGDVLVSVRVANDEGIDIVRSTKLLTAILQKI